jgi:flavin reductase (DIM6/NTAB) family NADH-FMN oxidoreductase RutF
VDGKDLRRAFGQFATGITVVGVNNGDHLHGMTANSFTSVSLDPPLVLVNVIKGNHTHGLIEAAGRFAISVLTDKQQIWSDQFAGRFPEKRGVFDVPHHLGQLGQPILEGALAWFECTVHAAYDGGDHTIFVGKVESFGSDPNAGEPLLFYDSRYQRLLPAP